MHRTPHRYCSEGFGNKISFKRTAVKPATHFVGLTSLSFHLRLMRPDHSVVRRFFCGLLYNVRLLVLWETESLNHHKAQYALHLLFFRVNMSTETRCDY